MEIFIILSVYLQRFFYSILKCEGCGKHLFTSNHSLLSSSLSLFLCSIEKLEILTSILNLISSWNATGCQRVIDMVAENVYRKALWGYARSASHFVGAWCHHTGIEKQAVWLAFRYMDMKKSNCCMWNGVLQIQLQEWLNISEPAFIEKGMWLFIEDIIRYCCLIIPSPSSYVGLLIYGAVNEHPYFSVKCLDIICINI